MLTLRLIYNNFGRSHYQHTPLLLLQNFLTRPIENVKYIEIDDSFSLGASNCHLLWKLNLGTFKVYQNDFRVYRNILTLYNDILRIARNSLKTSENIKISTHSFHHTNLDWFSWEWSKRKYFSRKKKNQNGRFFKIAFFLNRQFSRFFCKNFTDPSLG